MTYLAGGDAAGDEAALDRLADGHDRLHASRGIADTPDPGHRKAHAAVEDEQRAAAHEAGEEGQRSRTTFMGVSDLDAMAPDDARQPPRRARVPRPRHRHGDGLDAAGAAASGPPATGVRCQRHGLT